MSEAELRNKIDAALVEMGWVGPGAGRVAAGSVFAASLADKLWPKIVNVHYHDSDCPRAKMPCVCKVPQEKPLSPAFLDRMRQADVEMLALMEHSRPDLPVAHVRAKLDELDEEIKILFGDPQAPKPQGILDCSPDQELSDMLRDPSAEVVFCACCTLEAGGLGHPVYHASPACRNEADRLQGTEFAESMAPETTPAPRPHLPIPILCAKCDRLLARTDGKLTIDAVDAVEMHFPQDGEPYPEIKIICPCGAHKTFKGEP